MVALGDIISRGLAAARPAAGTEGRLYYSTDTGILERDSGSAWESVEGTLSGSGGAPADATYVTTSANGTLSAEVLLSAVIGRGDTASRPAFGTAGRLYYDTDASALYRDSGSAWELVEAATGLTFDDGATPAALAAAAASGDDAFPARRDHVHLDPVVAHASAADPHTGYQKESEKGAVSGYASLDATGKVPAAQLPATTAGPAQGTYLVSGGQVTWTSGYSYTVAAGTGYIDGTLYSWAEDSVTLDAADATLDRIDVIAVDTTGNAVDITGDAAANPSEPVVDPATQLQLAIVTVGAATTAPTVTSELLYAENAGSGGAPAEWDWTTSGSGWTLNSTSNPRTDATDIEGTTVAANAYIQGERGSGTIDPNAFSQLLFYLRLKALWGTARYLQVSFRLAGVQKGNALRVSPGYFGLDGTNTTTYQAVIIPTLQFAIPAGTLVDQLRIQAIGTGGTAIGGYIDDISITTGGATGGGSGGGLDQETADARYQQLSGKGAANGYASLDSGGKIPDAQIPAAIARDTEITAAMSSHEGASDPHTGYVRESLVDAKGDLLVATADNTPARLAVGTDGHVLTADSTEASGVKWAAGGGGGGAALTVQEIDGTPSDTAVTVIRVTNGKLTDNGAGDVTLDLSGGAVGPATDITVSDGALTTTEGKILWRGTRKVLDLYDNARERAMSAVGWQPFALQLGASNGVTASVTAALAANGGTGVVPIDVTGHLLLDGIAVYNMDATLARELEWRLYEDRANASNSVNEIAGANGTLSFTAAANAVRTSKVATPVYLGPGIYWLALRNTHASNSFGIAVTTPSRLSVSTPCWLTKTLGSALGSTLDLVAATWSIDGNQVSARLDGRVLAMGASL
jgi:hypothetical protein